MRTRNSKHDIKFRKKECDFKDLELPILQICANRPFQLYVMPSRYTKLLNTLHVAGQPLNPFAGTLVLFTRERHRCYIWHISVLVGRFHRGECVMQNVEIWRQDLECNNEIVEIAGVGRDAPETDCSKARAMMCTEF